LSPLGDDAEGRNWLLFMVSQIVLF